MPIYETCKASITALNKTSNTHTHTFLYHLLKNAKLAHLISMICSVVRMHVAPTTTTRRVPSVRYVDSGLQSAIITNWRNSAFCRSISRLAVLRAAERMALGERDSMLFCASLSSHHDARTWKMWYALRVPAKPYFLSAGHGSPNQGHSFRRSESAHPTGTTEEHALHSTSDQNIVTVDDILQYLIQRVTWYGIGQKMGSEHP